MDADQPSRWVRFARRNTHVIYTRDRTPLDAREAQVELADIPFVRMRDGLSEALRTRRGLSRSKPFLERQGISIP